MSTPSLSILEPDVVAQLATMELRARLVVEGFLTGLHKSPYHGFSVEFTEHRPYNPGDDIKHVDWKAFGKTDRYYIKQFEEETNLISTIVVDASASMGFSSGGRISKLRYASMTAAALAYLMSEQRDAVGLTIFDEDVRTSLPPHATRSHLKEIWKELEAVRPGRKTQTAQVLHRIAERQKRRGLVIIFSDLFDDPASVTAAFKHFRHNGSEVIVFQVLDPLERSFAFDRDAVFKDLETSEEMMSQPWHIRESYREAMAEFIASYERECREHAIDHVLLDTASPFDRSLMEYLHRRSRLH